MQHNGRTFGIRGVAEQKVTVECMWVEPMSSGLHYARFCSLPQQLRPINHNELQALDDALKSQNWQMMRGNSVSAQLYFEHPNLADTQLLVSTNWERTYFLLLRSKNPEPALKLVHQALTILSKQVSVEPPDASGMIFSLPSIPPSTPLGQVLGEFGALVRQERRQGAAIAVAVQELLKGLRLSNFGVKTMNAHFPAGILQLLDAPQEQWPQFLHESLPYLSLRRDSCAAGVVRVVCGASYFCAPVTLCEVTIESVNAASEILYWGLNSLRICTILRARKSGFGELALLADNAAQLVCDFIAPKPRDGAYGIES